MGNGRMKVIGGNAPHPVSLSAIERWNRPKMRATTEALVGALKDIEHCHVEEVFFNVCATVGSGHRQRLLNASNVLAAWCFHLRRDSMVIIVSRKGKEPLRAVAYKHGNVVRAQMREVLSQVTSRLKQASNHEVSV